MSEELKNSYKECKKLYRDIIFGFSERRLKSMLFWDVNNGVSRRSWARNQEAIFAIKRAMENEPNLKITIPNIASDKVLNNINL